MPLQTGPKRYIKDLSYDPIYKSVNYNFYFKSRILSGMLMSLGVLVLGTQVILPLVFFKTQDDVSKPLRTSVLGYAAGFSDFEFRELEDDDVLGSSADREGENNEEAPRFFTLSVPKLGIEDALVETNSPNLSPEDSLGHYAGSGTPGKIGHAFIYGHSVLPWFFNPHNYRTIFSTLGDLQTGDTINISYKGEQFEYVVESKEVLYPSEVQPLSEFKPAYLNESTVTLMTCWPAGTKTKRLLIKAVMSD